MKQKLLITCLCLAGWLMPSVAWAEVEINEANFLDANFRALLMTLPEGKDGVFTDEEIAGLHNLYLMEERCWYINSIKGIEHLTALEYVEYPHAFYLKELDLSQNKALRIIVFGSALLDRLDISGLPALKHLSLQGVMGIKELDLSGYENLESIGCSGDFEELNIQGCTQLKDLYCKGNHLTSLNLTNLPQLKTLNVSNNELTSLDLSGLTELRALKSSRNPLGRLDVSHNKKLEELWCVDNELTELDLSANKALRYLVCSANNIRDERMTALIASLPVADTVGQIIVGANNSEGEGNFYTPEQKALAKGKNWLVFETLPDYVGGDNFHYYTGIPTPQVHPTSHDSAFYTLDGRRLTTPPTKGIYIQNGRKMVIK